MLNESFCNISVQLLSCNLELNRELNNRINRIHERALSLVYQDHILSFSELLEKDNSVTTHQRNVQVLATEIFKLKNGLAPEIIKEVFEIQNPAYNFHSEAAHFKRESVKTAHYCIQTVRYLGPKIGMWGSTI